MTDPIGILATGSYLPPTVKPVADVFRDEDIPSEALSTDVDFRNDIGIDTVHVAGELTATTPATPSGPPTPSTPAA